MSLLRRHIAIFALLLVAEQGVTQGYSLAGIKVNATMREAVTRPAPEDGISARDANFPGILFDRDG